MDFKVIQQAWIYQLSLQCVTPRTIYVHKARTQARQKTKTSHVAATDRPFLLVYSMISEV